MNKHYALALALVAWKESQQKLADTLVIHQGICVSTSASFWSLMITFQRLLSWLLHKRRKGYLLPSWAQKTTCWGFKWMTTGTFSRNISKLFSELMLVTDDLFFIYKDSYTLSQHISGIPYLIPLAHTALFSLVSIRTSGVFICLYANFLMALMARGARLLNPLKKKKTTTTKTIESHHRSRNNSLDS